MTGHRARGLILHYLVLYCCRSELAVTEQDTERYVRRVRVLSLRLHHHCPFVCICILQARNRECTPLNRSLLTALKVPAKRRIRLSPAPARLIFRLDEDRAFQIARRRVKYRELQRATRCIRSMTNQRGRNATRHPLIDLLT